MFYHIISINPQREADYYEHTTSYVKCSFVKEATKMTRLSSSLVRLVLSVSSQTTKTELERENELLSLRTYCATHCCKCFMNSSSFILNSPFR